MKSLFTLLLVSLTLLSTAQNRCGIEVHTLELIEKYPQYAIAKTKVNAQTERWIKNHPNHSEKTIITIPVVVHVVWNTNAENISDAQILSQINVLNKDFRRINIDVINTPAVWQNIAADCEIEFCLAQTDPNGNITTGITRTQTSQTSFSMQGDPVKSSSTGGIDAWDNDDYLNIWVCDLGGGLLGYATPPSSWIGNTDGVVIGYKYFGNTGTAQPPYHKGRTTTHEIGHWLNLDHLWGSGGTCNSDNVPDTPKQEIENYSCPSFPLHPNACSTTNANGDMFMNYMDYTNDACMNLFTTGQKNRMISAINLYRSNLINNCVPPTWDCIGGSACVDPATGNGQYSSLSDCLTACGVMPSWDCFPNLNPAIYSCVDPGNGNGQYASLNACNLECALNGFSEEVSSLLIYPNPAKNTLTIDGDYTSVTIYNVVGKVVLTTDHQKTIDVAVLGSGIYFIHVNTKNGMTVKKIIIE